MKEYVCTVCGYVHKTDGELEEDFVCPLCGAGRDAFRAKEETVVPTAVEKPHTERELSAMEMSVICSNLARGCEKQYLPEESENFRKLASFFRSKAEPVSEANTRELLECLERDLSSGFPYGNAVASASEDRGALRCMVWAEKVTRMLQSLLLRYQAEGEKMLENTGVYVCTVCGFVYVGDEPPKLCPVCKVPGWKFEKVERREA
ncbi:MAG: rubredoxin-like domain-containing protein [Christensenellaceae bacterium]